MWMTLRVLQAALLLTVAACGSPDPSAAQPSNEASAPETTDARPFAIAEVVDFSTPWAMDFLPGSGVAMTSMALVTEKEGILWLVDVATGKRQQVSGVPSVKVAGQGGLGDVVVHPDFAGNQRVYLSYAEAGPNNTAGAALGYGRLVMGQGQPRIDGFKVIWRQPKVTGGGHFGHRIAFARDGTMFVSSSDRMKMEPAQDRGSDLGKILHMSAEGERLGGRFYAMGHRNVLGLQFAPDGRLWATEMGPRGGDEINLIVQGRNYGWPQASYGSHYDGRPIPDDHRGSRFEEPKVWWNPSISPAGMIVYSGNMFPQWRGDILTGALSGQALIRVDVDGDDARKGDRWDMDARIREVQQGPNGEVYLLEDGEAPGQGRLLRLTPARG
jgi:glucose/arabinose dehydrogenase